MVSQQETTEEEEEEEEGRRRGDLEESVVFEMIPQQHLETRDQIDGEKSRKRRRGAEQRRFFCRVNYRFYYFASSPVSVIDRPR